jgi:hypothetical protein
MLRVIGAMATRLGSITRPNRIGSNNAAAETLVCVFASVGTDDSFPEVAIVSLFIVLSSPRDRFRCRSYRRPTAECLACAAVRIFGKVVDEPHALRRPGLIFFDFQLRASHSQMTTKRGWLKNGNPVGDLADARPCGAKTRASASCRGPAMKNGRCRMHGGLSTGPRTAEGLARSRRANWKHGRYSAEARQRYLALKAECRAFNAASAAHHAEFLAGLRALLRGMSRDARNARRRAKRKRQL